MDRPVPGRFARIIQKINFPQVTARRGWQSQDVSPRCTSTAGQRSRGHRIYRVVVRHTPQDTAASPPARAHACGCGELFGVVYLGRAERRSNCWISRSRTLWRVSVRCPMPSRAVAPKRIRSRCPVCPAVDTCAAPQTDRMGTGGDSPPMLRRHVACALCRQTSSLRSGWRVWSSVSALGTDLTNCHHGRLTATPTPTLPPPPPPPLTTDCRHSFLKGNENMKGSERQ